MAKKKSVRKKSARKTGKSKKVMRSTKRKINLALRNLILFGVLSIISFMLSSVSSNEIYVTLFGLISMILGFIAFAFFIVLLVFLVLRLMKK